MADTKSIASTPLVSEEKKSTIHKEPCSYRQQYKMWQDDVQLYGNRQQWTCQDTFCLAVRSDDGGDWMGYIGLSREHPCYGKSYSSIQGLRPHGGLTGSMYSHEKDAQGRVYWLLGFDCGHLGDWWLKQFDVTPPKVDVPKSFPGLRSATTVCIEHKHKARKIWSALPREGQDEPSGEFRPFVYVKKQVEDMCQALVENRVQVGKDLFLDDDSDNDD